MLLNLHEEREPPPPKPITVTPLEREDESVVKLISIAHYSFERRREKEYTFSIRRVIFVRDFLSKKKGRSRRLFRRERAKVQERKKKREIPPPKTLFRSTRAFLCFKKLLRFITRAEAAHIYAHINE